MLIGEDKTTFMAKHLQLKGGGHPGRTAIFNALAKCKQPAWYPGKVDGKCGQSLQPFLSLTKTQYVIW